MLPSENSEKKLMQLPCSPKHVCVCKEKVLYTHIKFTRNLSPKMKKTIQQQHLVPFGVQLKSFVQNLLGKRRQSKHKVTYCYTLNTIK